MKQTYESQEQAYLATLQEWKDQGAEIYLCGSIAGSLKISDDLSQFGLDEDRNFSPELTKAIQEMGVEDIRLGLKETQRMLTSMNRYPPGMQNTQIAKADRLDALAEDDDQDDVPGPWLS